MALPVLRVGPLQWIADLQRIPEKYLLYKIELTEIEREKLEEQRKFDLFIQNIIGPYCIGIGTFINGISGFFSG